MQFEIKGDFVYVLARGAPDEERLTAAVSDRLGAPVTLKYSHEIERFERRRAKPGREYWYRVHLLPNATAPEP